MVQDGGSPFDGLVLMCSAKGAYVGRVLPEGRLILLHNIPRPPDTPQVSCPSQTTPDSSEEVREKGAFHSMSPKLDGGIWQLLWLYSLSPAGDSPCRLQKS